MSPRRSTLTIVAAAVAVLGSILTMWQQPADLDCRPVGGASAAACDEIVSGPVDGVPQDGVPTDDDTIEAVVADDGATVEAG